MFPKVPDHHKPDKPMVPNGLGVIYVLTSSTYLFMLHFSKIVESNAPSGVSPALTLAVCILFGGFLGLLDDWLDLRWRYKAFLPILASLPLAALREGTPIMATYFWGKIDFTQYGWVGETFFYFAMIPLIVTITTNTVNQLGGLNGLETLCPSVVLIGFLAGAQPELRTLLYVPIVAYLILGFCNFQGRIFVGNTGSFAIGITMASYALIANIEQTLVISILPYIINSSLILFSFFLLKERAHLSTSHDQKLVSDHRRSLVTLISYKRPTSERGIVIVISLLMIVSTISALLVQFVSL